MKIKFKIEDRVDINRLKRELGRRQAERERLEAEKYKQLVQQISQLTQPQEPNEPKPSSVKESVRKAIDRLLEGFSLDQCVAGILIEGLLTESSEHPDLHPATIEYLYSKVDVGTPFDERSSPEAAKHMRNIKGSHEWLEEHPPDMLTYESGKGVPSEFRVSIDPYLGGNPIPLMFGLKRFPKSEKGTTISLSLPEKTGISGLWYPFSKVIPTGKNVPEAAKAVTSYAEKLKLKVPAWAQRKETIELLQSINPSAEADRGRLGELYNLILKGELGKDVRKIVFGPSIAPEESDVEDYLAGIPVGYAQGKSLKDVTELEGGSLLRAFDPRLTVSRKKAGEHGISGYMTLAAGGELYRGSGRYAPISPELIKAATKGSEIPPAIVTTVARPSDIFFHYREDKSRRHLKGFFLATSKPIKVKNKHGYEEEVHDYAGRPVNLPGSTMFTHFKPVPDWKLEELGSTNSRKEYIDITKDQVGIKYDENSGFLVDEMGRRISPYRVARNLARVANHEENPELSSRATRMLIDHNMVYSYGPGRIASFLVGDGKPVEDYVNRVLADKRLATRTFVPEAKSTETDGSTKGRPVHRVNCSRCGSESTVQNGICHTDGCGFNHNAQQYQAYLPFIINIIRLKTGITIPSKSYSEGSMKALKAAHEAGVPLGVSGDELKRIASMVSKEVAERIKPVRLEKPYSEKERAEAYKTLDLFKTTEL